MNPLESILQLLSGQAQPRPDLGQQQPVATFAGRMIQPGQQNLMDILSKFPQAEAEQGGLAMQSPELLKQMALPMIGGMAKVFKPAATEGLPYVERLVQALKAYMQPGNVHLTNNRLLPSLHIAEGEPNLATNLLVGKAAEGHGPLYELADSMKVTPGTQRMGHGYFDPKYQVNLDNALNTLRYEPEKLKTATEMLAKQPTMENLNNIMEALNFTPRQ